MDVIVLAPVNSTCCAKFSVLAPETVMLAPIWILFALVKIRFVGGKPFPPTAPESTTFPLVPALNVNVLPAVQFSVLEKLISAPTLILPPFVLSKTRAPVRETGPTIAMVPPLVVIFPLMLMAVALAEEAV